MIETKKQKGAKAPAPPAKARASEPAQKVKQDIPKGKEQPKGKQPEPAKGKQSEPAKGGKKR